MLIHGSQSPVRLQIPLHANPITLAEDQAGVVPTEGDIGELAIALETRQLGDVTGVVLPSVEAVFEAHSDKIIVVSVKYVEIEIVL